MVTPRERVMAQAQIPETGVLGYIVQVASRMQQGVLNSYKRETLQRLSLKEFYDALLDLFVQAMVVAHADGILLVRAAARLELATGRAYVKKVEDITRRANLTPKQVTYVTEKYGKVAARILDDSRTHAEAALWKTMVKINKEDMHVKDGVKALRNTFISQGLTPDSNFRLETLVRTHTAIAQAAGRYQASLDPDIQEILWGYKYVTTGDDRVRDEHADLDGVTLPKDDPWWDENMPPNGWNCRCRIIEVFEPRDIVRPAHDAAQEGFKFNPGRIVEDMGPLNQEASPLDIAGTVVDSALAYLKPELDEAMGFIGEAFPYFKSEPLSSVTVGSKPRYTYGQITVAIGDVKSVAPVFDGRGAIGIVDQYRASYGRYMYETLTRSEDDAWRALVKVVDTTGLTSSTIPETIFMEAISAMTHPSYKGGVPLDLERFIKLKWSKFEKAPSSDYTTAMIRLKKHVDDVLTPGFTDASGIDAALPVFEDLATRFGVKPLARLELHNIVSLEGKLHGEYDPVLRSVRVAMKDRTLTAELRFKSKWTVDSSVSGTIRHEVGHDVFSNAPAALRSEWYGLCSAQEPAYFLRISKYGAHSPDEFFAECFNAFTHPKYKKGLPAEVESVLKRCVDMPASAKFTAKEIGLLDEWVTSSDGIYDIQQAEKRGKAAAFNATLDKLPKFKGTIYRGMDDFPDPKMREAFANAKPGQVIKFETSASTSKELSIAKDFAIEDDGVLLEIQSRTAADLTVYTKDMLDFGPEKEVVVRKGTAYRVISNEAVDGKPRLVLEETPITFKQLVEPVLTDIDEDALQAWQEGGIVSDIHKMESKYKSLRGKRLAELKEFHTALDKLPVYNGTAWRGMCEMDDSAYKKLARLSKGQVLKFDTSASMSKSRTVGVEFTNIPNTRKPAENAIIFEVRAKSAADITALPEQEFKYQREVVARMGTKYKVVGKGNIGPRVHIILQEL